MIVLSSNADLWRYLIAVEGVMKNSGLAELAVAVARTARQASGMSTEFLGEARITLRQVWAQGVSFLTESERADLQSVLKQLDEALDRRT